MSGSRFASSTSVPVERTRIAIETTLRRFGADGFGYATSDERAHIGFSIRGRVVRMELDLPQRTAREFTHTPARGHRRSIEAAHDAWEQGCRQRWRALLLVVKAKLAAIQDGISTVEREFFADLVLPSGRRMGDEILPQYLACLEGGAPPRLQIGVDQ